MSKQTVRFNVNLTIHPGKLEAFQSIAQTMIAGTQKEPGALAYEWHFSTDRKQCRLIETYSDTNAVLAHVNGPVVQQLVAKLLETRDPQRIRGLRRPRPPGNRNAFRNRRQDIPVLARTRPLTYDRFPCPEAAVKDNPLPTCPD